jgi:hypothetical protein
MSPTAYFLGSVVYVPTVINPDYVNDFSVHYYPDQDVPSATTGKVYLVSATSAPRTVFLPPAAGADPGAAIIVKLVGTYVHDVILAPVSGELINGLPNGSITGGVHLGQSGQARWIFPDAPNGGWTSF